MSKLQLYTDILIGKISSTLSIFKVLKVRVNSGLTHEVKLIKCSLCLASFIIASVSLRNSCITLRKRTSGRTSTAYKILIFSASLIWWILVLLTNIYSAGKAFLVRPDHAGYDMFNIVFLAILKVCLN
jgi:hypothetical protein